MLRRKLLAGIGTATTLALGAAGSTTASETSTDDLRGPSEVDLTHAVVRDDGGVKRTIPLGMLRNGVGSLDVGTMSCTAECCDDCPCDNCLCNNCSGDGGGGC